MSEHKHHFTDEGLSLNLANSYNLLLQINADSFNYAITFNNRLLSWAENYSLDELKDPQTLRDTLTANYKQVVIGLSSANFTLVPNDLFDTERVADIARFLDAQETEKVYHQPVNADNAIVYTVDQFLTSTLADFDHPSVNHKAKGWITAIANSSPPDKNLYINITGETADFLNFNNSKLRFYNTFNFKNHEELAYYAAFVAQELKIDPQDTSIYVSGEAGTADKRLTFLADFFKEVKLSPVETLKLPQQVEAHKILPLAALSLCASSVED